MFGNKNYSDDKKLEIQEKVQSLIKTASETLEVFTILHDNSKSQYACRFLRESARALVHACLAANDIAVSDDSKNIIEWKNLILQKKLIVPGKINIVPEVIQLNDQPLEEDLQKCHTLSQPYTLILYQLKKILEKSLLNDLATDEQRIQNLKIRSQKRKRTVIGAVVVSIFLGILFVIYSYQSPQNTFYDQAQIFWKSSLVSNWSEQYSHKFKIRVDDQHNQYLVELNPPVKMTDFRFDPTGYELDEVEIDSIQLININGQTGMDFNFNQGDQTWKCANCKTILSPNGTWIITPTNFDPYILSPTFPEMEIRQIKINLRLMDKVSFVEWMFAIRNER